MWRRHDSIGSRVLVVVAMGLLVFPLTLAQSKNTSKQAASLEKSEARMEGAIFTWFCIERDYQSGVPASKQGHSIHPQVLSVSTT